MSTKQPDQQEQLGTPLQVEAVTATTVHDAIVAAKANSAAPAVDTAGLNSLSEAAMKGIDSNNLDSNNDVTDPINEESKNLVVEQLREQTLDVMMATAATATATATGTAGKDESKIDLVLTKLDTILVRLDRIEAWAAERSRSSPAPKAASRQTRPRVKNTCPSMMKTLQGAPIQEMSLHFYDNEYHVLPEGWCLPRLSFEGLMEFWYIGDPNAGVPPLIKVGGTAFKNLPRGVRKRSDMKYLMKHVERKAKELGCYIDNINDWTIEAVRNLYARTKEFFEYPNKSSAQTKFDKLSWETVCHNLRRHKGNLLGEDNGAEDVEDLRGSVGGTPSQVNETTTVNEVPPEAGANGGTGRTLIDMMENPIAIPAPETPSDIQIPPETATPASNTLKDQDNDGVMESTNSAAPPEEPKGDMCSTV